MSRGKLGASLLVLLTLVLGASTLARAESVDCTPIVAVPVVITGQDVYCLTGDLSTAAMKIGRASCRERVCQYV